MSLKQPLYLALASLIQRKEFLANRPQFNDKTREMLEHVETTLERVVNAYLPNGSGFNAGTELLEDECKDDKLVFMVGYHHMNEHGYYDGWTHHKIVVTPSFTGFNVTVGGRDKNEIKDFIAETFYDCLTTHIEYRSLPRTA